MSASDLPRRGFLRGLASLPLIGGGVTLIGNPTAAAVPVTEQLLLRYEAWLDFERSYCRAELYGRESRDVPHANDWHVVWHNRLTGALLDCHHVDGTAGAYHYSAPPASTRAAIVLATVGCAVPEVRHVSA